MNIFNIERAFRWKKERDWDTLYWMIDVHNTILEGKYTNDQDLTPSDDAIEVLKWITDREDQKIIIWTSSYAEHFERLKKHYFDNFGIVLDFHNSNPECGNIGYADFTNKPYFNILLDDKACFEPDSDWKLIKDELIRIGEWEIEAKYFYIIGASTKEIIGACTQDSIDDILSEEPPETQFQEISREEFRKYVDAN